MKDRLGRSGEEGKGVEISGEGWREVERRREYRRGEEGRGDRRREEGRGIGE